MRRSFSLPTAFALSPRSMRVNQCSFALRGRYLMWAMYQERAETRGLEVMWTGEDRCGFVVSLFQIHNALACMVGESNTKSLFPKPLMFRNFRSLYWIICFCFQFWNNHSLYNIPSCDISKQSVLFNSAAGYVWYPVLQWTSFWLRLLRDTTSTMVRIWRWSVQLGQATRWTSSKWAKSSATGLSICLLLTRTGGGLAMETTLATPLTLTGRIWSYSMSTSMETREKDVGQGESWIKK